MAPTKQELSLLINPLVPEAVQHNNRVRLHLQLLTSSTTPSLNSLSPFPFLSYAIRSITPFQFNVPISQPPNKKQNQVLSSLHSLTAFLLGLSAGILALQSTAGFAFYFTGTVLVSALFHIVLLKRSSGAGAGAFFPGSSGGEIVGSIKMDGGVVKMQKDGKRGGYVLRRGAWRDVWFGGGVVSEALSGFVLGWAGVGGVLR